MLRICTVHAQGPGQYQSTILAQWGGEQLGIQGDTAPPGTFAICRNVIFVKPGEIRKRWAFRYATNFVPPSGGSSNIRAMKVWVTAGNSYLVVVSDRDTVYYTTDSTWTSLSAPHVGASSTYYDFSAFNTKLIMTASDASGDSARSWNGVVNTLTALAGGAPVRARFTRAYKNYLILGGNNTDATKNRIWFSALGDETTWAANDYIDVEPYDGDEITGLEVWQNSLLIFKRWRTFRLTGDAPTNFVVQEFLPGIGCLNYRSLQVMGSVVYFMAADGVYQLSPATGVQKISQQIFNLFDEANIASLFPGGTFVQSVTSAQLPRHNQYWLAINGAGALSYANRLFVYQTNAGLWSEFTEKFFTADSTNFSVISMASGPRVGSQPLEETIYIGRDGADRICRYPVNAGRDERPSANYYTIPVMLTTHPLTMDAPHLEKLFYWMYVTTDTDITDSIIVNGSVLSMASGIARNRLRLDTRGKTLTLTISHSTPGLLRLGLWTILWSPTNWTQ